MCGIVAVRWTNLNRAISQVERSLEILSNRGKDAWGMAIGKSDIFSEATIIKRTSRIDDRKNKKIIFRELRKIKNSGWLILHSRLATNGYCGLTEHNHPIQYRNTELVHNGLVVRWPNELDHLIDPKKTDSQNLAVVLDSIESSKWETLLNEISGEISIVWRSGQLNDLYIYTNVGGLYLDAHEDSSIISSEPIQVGNQSKKIAIGKIIQI